MEGTSDGPRPAVPVEFGSPVLCGRGQFTMLMSVNAKKSQATLVAESSRYVGKEVRLRGRGSTGLMASLIGLGDAYLLSDGTGQIVVHSYDGAPRINADTKEPFDVRGRLETMKEPWATIARQTGLPDVMVEEIERSR